MGARGFPLYTSLIMILHGPLTRIAAAFAAAAAPNLLQVHTLFPSPKTEEGIKGGVVLLRMKAPAAEVSGASPPAPLTVSVTYRDRSGQPFASNKEVPLPGWALGAAAAGAEAGEGAGGAGPAEAAEAAEGLFQSTGIRKAVALARYVDALQSW